MTWALFLTASVLNALLLWHFHDRYWYPTDDGLYAHIAERLLSGEVLNRDVQDIHPGYIHFLHAIAFRLFGMDLVSLRYPLIAGAFVQACLVFALLRRRDVLIAALGSVAITALGLLQFISPTANWYSLFLCIALASWLVWVPIAHPARLVGAGALTGTLLLFRHLSGVWVAMAVVVLALLEYSNDGRGRRLLLARALILTMFTALVGYLALSPETEPGGVLLMAVWPMAILVWMFVYTRTTNADVVSLLTRLAAGGAVPLLPLVLYHVVHGSLSAWLADNVFAAAGETQLGFFGQGWYAVLPLAGFHQAISGADPVRFVNGLYWLALPVLSALNGYFLLRRLGRENDVQELALPILAVFYALVSLYFEGPLYLYYTVGLTLVSVLWLRANSSRMRRLTWAATTAGLMSVAIVFHAGQSRTRTPLEILEGRRVSNVWSGDGAGLARASLRLDRADRDTYGRLVRLIQTEVPAGEPFLALPNDAELYFLAERPNLSRFYNSALGLRTDDEVNTLTKALVAERPRIVFYRPSDKYNNRGSRQVLDLVKSMYVHTDTIAGLEVYRLPGPDEP
jgi:hypothetical protein